MGKTLSAYMITNTINGKTYIGITTENLRKRWNRHKNPASECRAINKAIQKYGCSSFEWTHIACAGSLDDLKDLERILISQHGTLAPRGYNLTTGGDINSKMAPEVRRMMRESALDSWRRTKPSERIARCSAGLAAAAAIPWTEQRRANLSEALKIAWTRRENRSSGPWSVERRMEQSERTRGIPKAKESVPNYAAAGLRKRIIPDRILTNAERKARQRGKVKLAVVYLAIMALLIERAEA